MGPHPSEQKTGEQVLGYRGLSGYAPHVFAPPAGLNAGSNLVAHAVAGNDDRVRQVLQRKYAAYLRERADLAQRVRDERAIRGLTRAGLAAAANIDLPVLSAMEQAVLQIAENFTRSTTR